MPTEVEVREAKETAVQRYLSAPGTPKIETFATSSLPRVNVVGIGVGGKTTNGQATGELSVRFYLERKLPPGVIHSGSLLPSEINGVPTDVVETGRFRRLPTAVVQVAALIANQQKIRPAQPGCSCGFSFPAGTGMVMAGTFGAVVSDSNGRYILSNNHVLADEGKIPVGSPIFQPGLLDSGNVVTDVVGRLTRFIPISLSAMNHVDCALARIDPPSIVDPTFLPNVGKLASGVPTAPAVGMPVIKTGRTSGATSGTITDIHATVSVQYDSGVCQFDEQVVITGDNGPFSAAGDSGSVIVQRDLKQATALLFAGSATHTLANRLDTVLTALGVALVA
jgi:S1-C subfamily serine protease